MLCLHCHADNPPVRRRGAAFCRRCAARLRADPAVDLDPADGPAAAPPVPIAAALRSALPQPRAAGQSGADLFALLAGLPGAPVAVAPALAWGLPAQPLRPGLASQRASGSAVSQRLARPLVLARAGGGLLVCGLLLFATWHTLHKPVDEVEAGDQTEATAPPPAQASRPASVDMAVPAAPSVLAVPHGAAPGILADADSPAPPVRQLQDVHPPADTPALADALRADLPLRGVRGAKLSLTPAGTATLRGTVATQHDHDDVMEWLASQRGVARVVDRLRVADADDASAPASPAAPADAGGLARYLRTPKTPP